METKIIIAGSGGQGILFLGRVLAFGCLRQHKEVTWFPSYGAEIRGGTANCTVVISEEMIGSPVVLNPDILIAMNKASLDRFQPRVVRGGLIFYDSSLVGRPHIRDDLHPVAIPATKMASNMGNTKSANMVMLGALVARTGILEKSSILNIFQEQGKSVGSTASKLNTQSVLEGVKYVENTKSKNS